MIYCPWRRMDLALLLPTHPSLGCDIWASFQMAYACAKAAVIHIPRVTGTIYAGKNIRVNLVLPGRIYTSLLKMPGNSNSAEDREIHKKITRHHVPQGGMGDSGRWTEGSTDTGWSSQLRSSKFSQLRFHVRSHRLLQS